MRVLIDIVHPADVLFFKRPIEALRRRGDSVVVLSRHKDVACALLDEFGFTHMPVSRARSGIVGLATELLLRDFAVLRAARRFRPDVMIGFGGVAISHVGSLLSIPSISFYDSENAQLQTRLTWPFISRLYVPDSYAGSTPADRTVRLAGVKELSYLHPSAFSPDREIAVAHGLDPTRDNFLVRVVAWRANHDMGKRGWTPRILRAVLACLSVRGKVHLSSEIPLDPEFATHFYRGPRTALHHLLGHCRLLVGESATMASEAAVLGVPAIYAGQDVPGYIRELDRAGLVTIVPGPEWEPMRQAIGPILARSRSDVVATRDAFAAECPDWAEAVVAALDGEVARRSGTRRPTGGALA